MSVKHSIIIPTLNEEYFLEKNLKYLKSFVRDLEIIVSNGGSTDSTIDICKSFNVKVVSSSKGKED
jgi:glycosyltransferase involved in cell wall biosynthesis